MQKVYLRLTTISTDLVQSVNGTPISPALTVSQFVGSQAIGTWWVELDNSGSAVLCTNYPLLSDLYLDLTDNLGNNPYTPHAMDFFVGGRPARPIAR